MRVGREADQVTSMNCKRIDATPSSIQDVNINLVQGFVAFIGDKVTKLLPVSVQYRRDTSISIAAHWNSITNNTTGVQVQSKTARNGNICHSSLCKGFKQAAWFAYRSWLYELGLLSQYSDSVTDEWLRNGDSIPGMATDSRLFTAVTWAAVP
jgi:hypothetical protein